MQLTTPFTTRESAFTNSASFDQVSITLEIQSSFVAVLATAATNYTQWSSYLCFEKLTIASIVDSSSDSTVGFDSS